ncbi:MAG: mechanosensitive ion channel [Bacteroidota bacterium]
MDLKMYFENFLGTISSFLPGVLGALAVLIIGWLIASTLSKVIAKLVRKTGLQERLGKQGSSIDLYSVVKKFVYYILMVIVLLVVLEILGIENVLAPIEDMLSKFLAFIPNIIAALIIGFVGYILATIVSEIVGAGSGAIERFTDRMNMASSFDATRLVKQLVFLFIFIPILITAIDALKMEAISVPATDMLQQLMSAIPNILAAAIIIAVFYFAGRYVTQILGQLLTNLEIDSLPEKMGVGSVLGNTKLSNLIPNVAFFFLMFFGVITAVEKLGFTQITVLLNNMLDLVGAIFFGLIILTIGNFIAGIAYKALEASDQFLAGIARVAILGLFLAISLNAMGIADEIINLAFGLILGGIAVAVALSFGLGGRKAAGRQMEYILKKFRKEKE